MACECVCVCVCVCVFISRAKTGFLTGRLLAVGSYIVIRYDYTRVLKKVKRVDDTTLPASVE